MQKFTHRRRQYTNSTASFRHQHRKGVAARALLTEILQEEPPPMPMPMPPILLLVVAGAPAAVPVADVDCDMLMLMSIPVADVLIEDISMNTD